MTSLTLDLLLQCAECGALLANRVVDHKDRLLAVSPCPRCGGQQEAVESENATDLLAVARRVLARLLADDADRTLLVAALRAAIATEEKRQHDSLRP